MAIKHAVTATGLGRRIAAADWDQSHSFTGTPGKLLGADGVEVDPGTLGGGAGFFPSSRTALAALAKTSPAYLIEAGREGQFIFNSANLSALVTADTRQGMYVAPASDTTGASGAWVRKQTGNAIELGWFGIVADWNGTTGTDIYPAVSCAFNVIAALAPAGYLSPLDFRGGPPLHIPYGQYYCSSTWEPLFTGRIYGDGGIGWGAATRINFPSGGVTALRLQSWFTSGASTYPTAEHFSGDQLVIEHIAFLGPNRNGTGRSVESEGHGCHTKRPVTLRFCTFDGFEGDGFYNVGDTGAQGVADECLIEYCQFWYNRNGAYLRGADSNAHVFIGNKFNFNHMWGVDDDSGLGNSYIANNFASNGVTDFSQALGASTVSYGGNQYGLVDGQVVGAATNPPSGTTADNTWWFYIRAGGSLPAVGQPSAGKNIPLWTNGMLLRTGGPYRLHGPSAVNMATANYVESDQSYPQVQSPSMVIAGNSTIKGTGGFIQQIQGNLHITNPYMRGSLYQEQLANTSFTFSGVENVVTPTMIFKTGTTNGTIEYRDSANVKYGEIIASSSNGLYIDNKLGLNLRYNGVTTANVTATGIDLPATYYLTVAGTKVVGARQTGWTASTGTPARGAFAAVAAGTASAAYAQSELQGALNRIAALEARLIALEADTRTHGLIN